MVVALEGLRAGRQAWTKHAKKPLFNAMWP